MVNERSGFGISDLGLTWAYTDSEWNEFTTETSMLEAGRNLTLSAGNDVIGEAAALYAGNDLTIDAGRDVRFSALQNEKWPAPIEWSTVRVSA
ncbi:MAG: hemagglutinin repeat-containing protein [Pseudomonadota bacterium]